jgi:hypothetical protein
MQTLDDVLARELPVPGNPPIAAVKLDVEGLECDVLEGGLTLFTKYRVPLIQVELALHVQKHVAKCMYEFARRYKYAIGWKMGHDWTVVFTRLASASPPWLASAAVGYCEATEEDKRDTALGSWRAHAQKTRCKTQVSGNFKLTQNESTSMETAANACMRLCQRCDGCNVISFSEQWSDCSWFSSCDLTRLKEDVPSFLTSQVQKH